MAIYTVSITDGTTLANLAVSAGRGPKGDGFTGVTFDNTTKTFTFTSNDGLGFTSDPITIDLLADPTPQLVVILTLTATTSQALVTSISLVA